MNTPSPDYDLFELFEGGYAAFLGPMGDDGLLLLGKGATRWEFHPPGSLAWGDLHQAAYRNHRVTAATLDDLAKLELPAPPVEDHRGPTQAIEWGDNFKSEVSLSALSRKTRRKIEKAMPTMLWVVLAEDDYESSFGDGKFLYPESVSLDRADAQACMGRLQEHDQATNRVKGVYGYSFTLKEIPLELRDGQLRAQLDLKYYERYGLDDLLRKLN